MKTTEVFIEQVLIGALVLLSGGLMFWDAAREFISSPDIGKIVLKGTVLTGVAYLLGIVYDRIADSLLEDLNRHNRLNYALHRFHKTPGVTVADIFPENKYRINILKDQSATNYANYLRSRIRLTRALTTLIPAIALSLLLMLIKGKISYALWSLAAGLIPVIYGFLFWAKLLEGWELSESSRGTENKQSSKKSNRIGEWICKIRGYQPPKTNNLCEVSRYIKKYSPQSNHRSFWWFAVRDRLTHVLLLPISIIGIALIILSKRYCLEQFLLLALLPIGGNAIALIVGWSWWRISETYFSFLHDFHTYKPANQPK